MTANFILLNPRSSDPSCVGTCQMYLAFQGGACVTIQLLSLLWCWLCPGWYEKVVLSSYIGFLFGPRQANLVLLPMRAAIVQASLRIRAVSPEPPLLAHTSSESRGTFKQKSRFLAPLNGWACAVKICHDGMLEDTNSLDASHFILFFYQGLIIVELWF